MPSPFQQLRFEDIPKVPRKAHDYDSMRVRDIAMESKPFGKLTIHTRELGEGPPLLLLHGLMTTSYSWRYVVKRFAEHFRVIVPDMPGAGKSTMNPNASYDVASLAAWVSEFVDAAGIRGCVAIGNSLGGYVMMRAVLDDPSVVARLVNVHSPAFPEARYFVLHAALAIPGVKSILSRVIRNDPLRWVHKNVHYADETLKSLEEAHAYGDPLATPDGAASFLGFLEGAMAPHGFARFIEDLGDLGEKGFPVPLRLVYATTDPLVKPANGRRLKKLVPSAELLWLENTSHFAHVDTPDPLVESTLPFLRGA